MNSLTSLAKNELKKEFPDIVFLDVSMAMLSHWRIGGRVAALLTPRTEKELAQVCAWIESRQLPSLVIGNTTNLLFSDEGVNAVVIQVGKNFSAIQIKGRKIIAQAGVYVPCLARKSLKHGLTGLEHTIGIPGTLGGLVCMNGGSQRKAIGGAITYIKAMSRTGKTIRYMSDECGFAYRKSIFQELDHIITEVGIALQFSQNKTKIHNDMLHILRERSGKFPRKLPNCGSVFVSNPAMYEKFGPPGKIIEDCRLKGMVRGGAQISSVHANFIVNKGGATAEEVLWLIKHIRSTVYKKTGYSMVVEAKFVNKNGEILTI